MIVPSWNLPILQSPLSPDSFASPRGVSYELRRTAASTRICMRSCRAARNNSRAGERLAKNALVRPILSAWSGRCKLLCENCWSLLGHACANDICVSRWGTCCGQSNNVLIAQEGANHRFHWQLPLPLAATEPMHSAASTLADLPRIPFTLRLCSGC
jgi:hypothetical protein